MTPEGRVKKNVKEILNCYSNVFYFMPVPTGYGSSGVHDFVCCIAGQFLTIECKTGTSKMTPLQQATMDRIKDAGGHVMLVNETNIRDVALVLMHFGATPK